MCLFSENGVEPRTCGEHSRTYRRNIEGCCTARCNSAARFCHRCLLERDARPLRARDPVTGLCTRHGILSGVFKQLDAEQYNDELYIFPEELEAMAKSTDEECARLSALDENQTYVLSRLAYGFDTSTIDRELAKRPGATGLTVATVFPIICERLEITGIERESERVRKAGKILIDAKERESVRGRVILKDGNPSSPTPTKAGRISDILPKPAPAAPAAKAVAPAKPALAEPAKAAPAAPAKPASESERCAPAPARVRQMGQPVPMRIEDAREVAARYCEARASDKPAPHIHSVVAAVLGMKVCGMVGQRIGEAFGYEGKSAEVWCSSVSGLSRVEGLTWDALGTNNISVSAMKGIAALNGVRQIGALNLWLEKRGMEIAGAVISETSDDSARSLPRSINGDSLKEALLKIVRIDLGNKEEFVDVDIIEVKVGGEFADERERLIMDRREEGYEPGELVIVPTSPPSAYLVFTKSAY